jgi:cytochrome P450
VRGPSARELPSASPRESIAFTLKVMLPNLLQGLFRRRRRAVSAATSIDVDRRAAATIAGLRDGHGSGPIWVKAGGDRMLLALATADIRRVLEGSPEPFAPDPDAKRRGMSHFQPDALTISRGELWANRRRFAEEVLDTGRTHRHGDRLSAVAAEEMDLLLADVGALSGELGWDAFQSAGWRITRRMVFGDSAREDLEVTRLLAEMMDEGNKLPKEGEVSEHLDAYLTRVRGYIDAAEPGSLVSLFPEAPSDEDTRIERQVTHWLFATGDTLSTNAFRALALIASHSEQREKVVAELAAAPAEGARRIEALPYLEACMEEAMRLWPTTPVLSRETLEDTSWDGATVPAGTQILISNTFNHRDPERHPDGDRFRPEAWTEGDRGEDWSLNHFSRGPQGCPGAGLALFIGKAMLGRLLDKRRVVLLEPRLDPERPLPRMIDFFGLRFGVESRT